MKQIGYFGGSMKPFHSGHYYMIKTASVECDLVHLVISTVDRARPGEFSISAKKMEEVWNSFILPMMPENIEPIFVQTPIKKIYELIGEADQGFDTDTLHVIYGDDVDIPKIFTTKSLKKYFPRLMDLGLVQLKPYSRSKTINISSTQMRKYLELDLQDDFIKGLPSFLHPWGNQVWNILYK